MKIENNTIDKLVEDFECDSVFCQIHPDFEEMVNVNPYDTKTGKWVSGINYITSWDEVAKSKYKKVCREDDEITKNKLEALTKNLKV